MSERRSMLTRPIYIVNDSSVSRERQSPKLMSNAQNNRISGTIRMGRKKVMFINTHAQKVSEWICMVGDYSFSFHLSRMNE